MTWSNMAISFAIISIFPTEERKERKENKERSKIAQPRLAVNPDTHNIGVKFGIFHIDSSSCIFPSMYFFQGQFLNCFIHGWFWSLLRGRVYLWSSSKLQKSPIKNRAAKLDGDIYFLVVSGHIFF